LGLLENFIFLLESRLEVVLKKLNFALTIEHARQLIVHGKVYINGLRVNNPNTIVSKNSLIQLKLGHRTSTSFLKLVKIPKNFNNKNVFVDFKTMSGVFIGSNDLNDFVFTNWMNLSEVFYFYRNKIKT
jgi:small subunit ribosomal protein S4